MKDAGYTSPGSVAEAGKFGYASSRIVNVVKAEENMRLMVFDCQRALDTASLQQSYHSDEVM